MPDGVFPEVSAPAAPWAWTAIGAVRRVATSARRRALRLMAFDLLIRLHPWLSGARGGQNSSILKIHFSFGNVNRRPDAGPPRLVLARGHRVSDDRRRFRRAAHGVGRKLAAHHRPFQATDIEPGVD